MKKDNSPVLEFSSIKYEREMLIAEELTAGEEYEHQYDLEEMFENAADWIILLAHLIFDQGVDEMRTINGPDTFEYCCLGVADYNFGTRGSLNIGEFLDERFAACVGLLDETGTPSQLVKYSHLEPLSSMNDKGFTFAEIAEHLIEWPYAYFKNGVADLVAELFWANRRPAKKSACTPDTVSA